MEVEPTDSVAKTLNGGGQNVLLRLEKICRRCIEKQAR